MERMTSNNTQGLQGLPRLCPQEQGLVSRIQEQAARLLVSPQQGRILSGSRQGPATIIYSGSTDTATLRAVTEHIWLQAN